MAEVKYNVLVKHPGWLLVEWPGMVANDTGVPLEKPEFSFRSITVLGTNGTGGSVAVQGCNSLVQTDWASLNDIYGAVIAAETGEAAEVGEHTLYVRPKVAGDGSTIYTVRMFLSGSWRR